MNGEDTDMLSHNDAEAAQYEYFGCRKSPYITFIFRLISLREANEQTDTFIAFDIDVQNDFKFGNSLEEGCAYVS